MQLSASFVIVVGACGIGSHVVSLLARSGVKRLRLIDPAILDQADLAHHALAIQADVGDSKAEVTRRALLRTAPVRGSRSLTHGELQLECLRATCTCAYGL